MKQIIVFLIYEQLRHNKINIIVVQKDIDEKEINGKPPLRKMVKVYILEDLIKKRMREKPI